MKKLDWNKSAAIAEVIGTVAVVVSLVFVVQSVNQNTDALQNANLNHVYDRLDDLNSDIAADPQLALVYADKVLNLNNIDANEAQYIFTMRRELNQWEQYHDWRLDGLIDEDDWTAWDGYYTTLFISAFPKKWWQSMRKYYNEELSLHVDQIYDQ